MEQKINESRYISQMLENNIMSNINDSVSVTFEDEYH